MRLRLASTVCLVLLIQACTLKDYVFTNVSSIAVAPSNPTVVVGKTQQFTANATVVDGSSQDVTGSVGWSSSNTTVASINASGLATALAVGTTTIQATSGPITGMMTLTVISLSSITVSPSNPSIPVGATQQFTASGRFNDGSSQDLTSSVTWSSSNGTVASINATGLASALAAGSTTIQATSGTVMGTMNLTVTLPPPRFAYAANRGSDTVSLYTVNAATGQLRHNGYVTAGSGVFSVTVDPAGKFVFVANILSNNVSAFTINSVNGALTPVAGSPFAAGTNPFSIAVDPSGKFAYVANFGSTSVSAYTINTSTGALTAVSGSPFTSGAMPTSVAVDASGKFVYVANSGSNNVSAYTINASTGALTAVSGSPFPTGTSPFSVTVDPSGKFVYTANNGSNNVSVFAINSSTGALTQVAGSPFAAGTAPFSVTVDPTGNFAYVANDGSNNVSAYAISA
ncbi:MAG TPA: beta-propeller fold lactonase family protein, partial [Myxococcaceae bacterium]|nr:beta-propeller fold lactonase family protein [Myxococcaceae bacterium]